MRCWIFLLEKDFFGKPDAQFLFCLKKNFLESLVPGHASIFFYKKSSSMRCCCRGAVPGGDLSFYFFFKAGPKMHIFFLV